MATLAGNDFYSGHHVVHNWVVDLLADQTFNFRFPVDAQQVHQELDRATLEAKKIVNLSFYFKIKNILRPGSRHKKYIEAR